MSLLDWGWLHCRECGVRLEMETASEPYKYYFEIKPVMFPPGDVWDIDNFDRYRTRYLLTGSIWTRFPDEKQLVKAWFDSCEKAEQAAEAALVTLKLEGKI